MSVVTIEFGEKNYIWLVAIAAAAVNTSESCYSAPRNQFSVSGSKMSIGPFISIISFQLQFLKAHRKVQFQIEHS